MNNIDYILLSLTCKCKFCLILPVETEKKLFARSVAIYQELRVFYFIFFDKDIQLNIATVVEAIA